MAKKITIEVVEKIQRQFANKYAKKLDIEKQLLQKPTKQLEHQFLKVSRSLSNLRKKLDTEQTKIARQLGKTKVKAGVIREAPVGMESLSKIDELRKKYMLLEHVQDRYARGKATEAELLQAEIDLEKTKQKYTKQEIKIAEKFAKSKVKEAKRFKAEFLSIMFGGMMVHRIFGGIYAAGKQAAGIDEVANTIKTIITLPAALKELEMFWIPMLNAVSNMSEESKLIAGGFIRTADVAGELGSVLASSALTTQGFELLLGSTVLKSLQLGNALKTGVKLTEDMRGQWFGLDMLFGKTVGKVSNIWSFTSKVKAKFGEWLLSLGSIGLRFGWILGLAGGIYDNTENIVQDFIDLLPKAEDVKDPIKSIEESLEHSYHILTDSDPELEKYEEHSGGIKSNFKKADTNAGNLYDKLERIKTLAKELSKIFSKTFFILGGVFGLAAMTLTFIQGVVHNLSTNKLINKILSGASVGTPVGAAAGTFAFPGIGTLAGGSLGAIGGGIAGALDYFGFFANGGIVTKPTLAVVGEAGPEAIVPLNKAMGYTYAPTITVNASIASDYDVERLAEVLNEKLHLDYRRGGML